MGSLRRKMKKIFQFLCSGFFATSICCSVDAFVVPVDETSDISTKISSDSTSNKYYKNSLLEMDLGDLLKEHSQVRQKKQILFVSDSQGNIITNAQVVATIIPPSGSHIMKRAWPFGGGYLIPTGKLSPGQYRVEVEVITGSQLMTDEFVLLIT